MGRWLAWLAAVVATAATGAGTVLLVEALTERPPVAEQLRPIPGAGSGSGVGANGSGAGGDGDAAAVAAVADTPIKVRFKNPPRAGMVFDVDSGEVLWRLHPNRRLPIASLNKMMTGLIIAEDHRPGERVAITRTAARYPGSRIGLLKPGRRPSVRSLLAGLMLVSGNDAAVALAQHDAGSVPRFVARMNLRARRLGLSCTSYTSPHGLQNEGNHSCPRDLARLARLYLSNSWLRQLARTPRLRLPFPTEGGHVDLPNTNPLMRLGVPGITGLKTGYTRIAGRCIVSTARRAGRHVGVILLHSPDPPRQVMRLLRAVDRAEGRVSRAAPAER